MSLDYDTPDDELESVPVADLHRADYVLGLIGRARRVRDEELDVIRAERDRLDLLATAIKERCARVEDWYGPQLSSFHRALLADDPKRRTISLPHGTLRARAQQDEWTFGPEFTEWAEASGRDDLVRVKVEPDRTAAKKRLLVLSDGRAALDGEVVPGVSVQGREPKFEVVT